jgi:hypothetical protein
VAVGAAVAAGFLVGRSSDESSTQTVTVSRERDTSICVNPTYGFALAYPRGWHTDPAVPDGACFFFDPKPFQVPEASDFGGTALEVQVAQQDPELLVQAMLNPRFTTSRKRDSAIAAGRRVSRVEFVTNGEGLQDAGTRVYAYVVDRDDLPPLVIQTSAAPGKRLQRDVVDEAAQSLRLFRPAVNSLPQEVEDTRAAIVRAARARDFTTLRKLIPKTGFAYTYGATSKDAVDYWLELERTTKERPFETLANILELPYTLNRGLYVWPFVYDKAPDELTDYERGLLGPLADVYAGDSYLGWRAGIRPDGRLIFFISGD